LVEMHL